MPRGRPRTPVSKNLANGNPSGRPIQPEPRAASGAPCLPPLDDTMTIEALRDAAFEHFVAVAAETPGWIQSSDTVLLEMAASHYALWRLRFREVMASGDLKAHSAALKEAHNLKQMLTLMGFTPADRSRISAPAEPTKTLQDILLGEDDDD